MHTEHHPDFQDTKSRPVGRRASDVIANAGPTNADLMAVLIDMRGDINGIQSAFPVKDGKPNYHGHRAGHEAADERDRNFANYKVKATEKIVGWGVMALLMIFGTGAIEHIKKLLGV